MYEGKFEDDIVIGTQVLLRNNMVGEVYDIDHHNGTYQLKIPDHTLTEYNWGSFKGPKPSYDIMSMVVNTTTEDYQYDVPDWAYDLVPEGLIVVGQQLLTKDGRVTGNAAIFNIAYDIDLGDPKFYCITDAGNIIKLTIQELNSQFYLGKYIMKDYPGDPTGTKLEYTDY